MSTVTGVIIFDANRNAQIDFQTDGAITNTPLVLQSTDGSLNTIATLSDGVGEFEFINVPIGNYKLSVVDGYNGPITPSPADYTLYAKPEPEITQGKVPGYESAIPVDRRVEGMNALNAVMPTTINVEVINNEEVDIVYFFIGPALYKSFTPDNNITILPENLITAGDNGTFGKVVKGSYPNNGPADNPYPGDILSEFTWIKQSNEIPTGYYTIGNLTQPYNETETYNWWRLSDHTTSIETGRMQIIVGNDSKFKTLSTTVNNLQPNTTYLLTAWVSSLNKNQPAASSKRGVSIDGLNSNTTLYSNLEQMIDTDPKLPIWQEIGIKFNTGANNYVSLNILSVIPLYFAIDDIMLRRVIDLNNVTTSCPTDYLCITNGADRFSACIGDTITFSICICNTSNLNIGTYDSPIMFSNILSESACFIPNTLFLNNMPLDCVSLCNINLGIFRPYEQKSITFRAYVRSNCPNTLTSCAKVVYSPSNSNTCCSNNAITIAILNKYLF